MAVILRGRYAAILDQFDRDRMVAYEQAQWIALGFNGKIPPFEPRAEVEKVEDERQRLVGNAKVRGWFISQALRSRNGASKNRRAPG